MLSQTKVIKTIRSLHRRKEPLNITAAKRRHPELVQSVYAVKPFWGWKQALKDAGVDYARIRVELQEYLTCEICNKDYRHLANHVILKHGVTMDEYLMDYPDAELVCEEMRARWFRNEIRPIPHWEPCWSREYVLDRVAEYHRRGYPMCPGKSSDIDSALFSAAMRYAGGWKEALITVGLDPRKLTQEAYQQLYIYRDKEAVVQGIRQRLKKRLPLNSAALYRKDDRNKGHVGLLRRGIEFFGSWNNALTAAGVDPEVVRKAIHPRKYATRQDVIHEIRARHKRKWAISHGKTYKPQKNRDVPLVQSARDYFGSWNNALMAAGFDPIKIHRQALACNRRYPDEKSALKALKQRSREGRLMNFNELVFGPDKDIPLIWWARKYFNSWNNALRKIGLNPAKIQHDARVRGHASAGAK